MDLTSRILCGKCALKPTETLLYSPNGDVHLEKYNNDGSRSLIKMKDICNEGYVVDLTPDLQMGCIFPWLYFGSQDVAHDYELLLSKKITDIVTVGGQCPDYINICKHVKYAEDIDTFDICSLFYECFEIIDRVQKENRVVYVHCSAGVSRSASIIIAYVMHHLNWDYEKAYEFVKSKRAKIKPNPGFQCQLRNFSEFLKRSK